MYNTINYSKYRERQKSFKSSNGEIKFIDEGKGVPILLLHGIPTSGWLYRKMITPLVNDGFRVIVPDMLGFGSSSSPEGYDIYHEKEHAKRLLELMAHLKIEKWSHVFHDAGGLWTWELLQIQPNRVNSLVILNTIIYNDGFKPPVKFGKNGLTKSIIKLYKTKLFNGLLIKKLFDSGLQNNNLISLDLEGYKTPLLEGKINAMYYFFSKTKHKIKDYSKLLKSLNIPTIVIWGKDDTFLKWEPQDNEVKIDLKIKKNDIHLIEAKHFIQEEKPELIVNSIVNFLKR